jgi:selenocysteine lyase/cysteine desulfurase
MDGPDAYLLDPGLIHLNTGTYGAQPRSVHERTVAAMRQFESNPVLQGYREREDTVLGQAETARKAIGAFFGAQADEILVTHGTADALGQCASAFALRAGERVLTTGAEHDSGVFCWRWLARRAGGHLDVLPLAPDELDDDAIVARFAQAIGPQTRLVCISDVIAWTGQRLPIARLSELAHARGALLVVDGAQAVGHVPVDLPALGCDAYAGSGHKWLLGPKGSGFLYVRKDPAQRIFPVAWEDKVRLNSEAMGGCPLPHAIGLGEAVAQLQRDALAARLTHNRALRDELWAQLLAVKGATPVGPPPGHAQSNGLLGFKLPDGVDAAALRSTLLAKYRINIRAVDPKQWNGLRASLHVYNTPAHVEALASALRAELG